jgi:hypothetical protein
VTPTGTFTDFLFTGTFKNSSSSVGEMVNGPDGAIWFTAGSPDVGEPGIGIGRIDSSGNTTLVASLPNQPTNLVAGPDGNLWFVEGANVDKMTMSGAITQYSLPGYSSTGQLHFAVGSDGNFWAPFPYGQQTFLKFSTNGTVVSNAPLSYIPPWYPYNPGAATVPLMQQVVSDPNGYVFVTDATRQGVLRIDGSGNITAYPTYSTALDIVDDDPLYLVRGANGNLYLSSMAVLGFTQAEFVPAFTMLDNSLWGGGNAGVTGAPFSPPYPSSGPPPVYITATPASVTLMDLSATQQVTLQDGSSGTLSVDGSTCAGIANVSQTNATTFTFSAVAVGTCEVTAADSGGHSIVIPVSVQTTSVVVQ